MAPAETPKGFLRIARLGQVTAIAMADGSIFDEISWGFHLQQAIKGLSRFTIDAVLRRDDDDPDQERLERAAWNKLGTELLAHVATLC